MRVVGHPHVWYGLIGFGSDFNGFVINSNGWGTPCNSTNEKLPYLKACLDWLDQCNKGYAQQRALPAPSVEAAPEWAARDNVLIPNEGHMGNLASNGSKKSTRKQVLSWFCLQTSPRQPSDDIPSDPGLKLSPHSHRSFGYVFTPDGPWAPR